MMIVRDSSLVRAESHASYYTIECGAYALYEFENGKYVHRGTASRLAVAYDSDALTFYRLGEASEVMRWAAGKREYLRGEGYVKLAENLAVAMLPRRFEASEFNRLLSDPEYITTFLAKAGLV